MAERPKLKVVSFNPYPSTRENWVIKSLFSLKQPEFFFGKACRTKTKTNIKIYFNVLSKFLIMYSIPYEYDENTRIH